MAKESFSFDIVSEADLQEVDNAVNPKVFSCFLEKQHKIRTKLKKHHGGYLYVLEGGPLYLNNQVLHNLDAALIKQETGLLIEAKKETEFLFVVASMNVK